MGAGAAYVITHGHGGSGGPGDWILLAPLALVAFGLVSIAITVRKENRKNKIPNK